MKKTLLTVVMAAAVMMSGCESNPLIKPAKTPFGAPEFTKIKIEHYMPAFEQGLKEARAELEATINNPEAPTFENTIEAMERGGELLNYVSNIFFVLDGNETSPEMQELALEIQPKLVEFYNDLNLNPTLWQRVKTVYEQRESLGLNEEQAKLLENTYKDFVRSGANLSDEAKEEYRKISTELSMLTLKFGQNVLAATNAFTLNITNPDEVAELPDFVKEILAAEAKAHEQEGWTVSLQPASMTPFLTYSSNRGYKEQVWKAYNSRCIGGELDNTELIKQITDLRLRSAQLLGYPTYADFVLEKRMAENPTTVNNFLDELLDATIGQARKEVAEVQRYARKNGAKYELMPWDFAYWSEKYKNATYAYNEEDVKPYFELNNVKNGIFALCDKLYGIKFVENKEVDGYHPDVQVYEVREENGELLGLLYMDFFPRATKRGGAWMTSFRDVYVDKDGKEVRPLISMCGNFTKPTETTPSLLTFDEFETFLHEFGHCLHGLFGKGSYASLTGTSVYRDFVELPSQIMENWCVEPEFLDMVATHYQTGEKMPTELRDKVIKAKKFLVAYYNTRQVAYATSDMQFHTITAPIADAVAFEKEARKECEVLPTVEGCSPCAAFSHIFSGGYAAGYYGYKWAEVLDADAFALFTEKGIFSKEVAGSFRDNILSQGGIRHPMDLYVAFRGHKPATQALIDEIVPRK
ncbi:MAG: M3 family metallopeptidase [Tidjanibacter sp.]|nr:M3 family metallopeptidase [Tidjanibacter sp.]